MVWVLAEIKEERKWGRHSLLCFLTVDAHDQMPLVPDTIDSQTEPKSCLVTVVDDLNSYSSISYPHACTLLRKCTIGVTKVQN